MKNDKTIYECPKVLIVEFEHQGVVCQTQLETPGEDPEGEW
jgi:hypothetical protein